MPGRRNHPPTHDADLAERRARDTIEGGEKAVGDEAEWLDRLGPAAHEAREGAAPRHSHVRQQQGGWTRRSKRQR
ncbi:MAG: hypothetical protein QOE90_3690 [Thermoplasmata archaeon]|jgi:hypothetical protein|nr:hypothetical protein [Thermoplasmata archaeon]